MKCAILLGSIAAVLFVANIQLRAEDLKPMKSGVVRGAITKIDGNTLTVDDAKTVTTDDKTVVTPGGKDAIKVGANITVNIKDGVAVKIEIKKAPFPSIRGVISKIDGNNLTVGKETVVINGETEVVPGGKDALKVGANISARIHDGVADRIVVHQPK
jgi:hypothetical protein